MNELKSDHEQEQRLALMRHHWQEDRARVQSELEYARRSVAALELMLFGYESAMSATSQVEPSVRRLDGRNSDKYPVNKSYEVGSGERY